MKKVLLVADAPWVRNDVVAALDAPRRRIVMIDDPRAVLVEAESHAPHAYVVDMQVGSMGGMAIIRAIKEAIHAGRVPEAPIVLLLDRQADAFIAKRAGATSWLVKPFTAQALRAALSALDAVEA